MIIYHVSQKIKQSCIHVRVIQIAYMYASDCVGINKRTRFQFCKKVISLFQHVSNTTHFGLKTQ